MFAELNVQETFWPEEKQRSEEKLVAQLNQFPFKAL